ncbi:MAG: hypothetical protein WBW32_03135 [Luteibacter sp.]
MFGEEVERKLRDRIGWTTAAVASSIAWPKKDVRIIYGDDFILRGPRTAHTMLSPGYGAGMLRVADELDALGLELLRHGNRPS